MKYLSAAKGIKKIYIAEILCLLSAFLSVAMLAILAANGIHLQDTGDTVRDKIAASGMILPIITYGISSVVLILVGFIMNLAGLIQAGHDEETFKRALWAALAGIAISVATSLLSDSNPGIVRWLEIASTVCSMTLTLLVCNGIGKIADSLGNKEVSDFSKNNVKFLISVFVLSAVVELIVAVLDLNETATTLCKITIGVMDIIVYVFYIRLLGKARLMLS